jgi:hypothetical protein
MEKFKQFTVHDTSPSQQNNNNEKSLKHRATSVFLKKNVSLLGRALNFFNICFVKLLESV